MKQQIKKVLSLLLFNVVLTLALSSGVIAYEENPSCNHSWQSYFDYKKCDSFYHYMGEYCYYCSQERFVDKQMHDWSSTYTYSNADSNYHRTKYECYYCGETKYVLERHNYLDYDYYSQYVNPTYHKNNSTCWDCGAILSKTVAHTLDYNDYQETKLATLNSNGIISYRCTECDTYIPKTVSWKLNANGCCSYNFYHSDVYRNSKYIKVVFDNYVSNSYLKIKIGSKTYKKKITAPTKSVKIKIKKPKYGKRISITLTCNGKIIGTDYETDDVVWYAARVKKNMTKNQVRYTWGNPDDTSSASGGWSYWFYDDGSYIGFKKGKVRFWYDAEG